MRTLPILALIFACLLPAAGAHARDLDQDEALQLRRAGVILPLEVLLARALARYPGAVLLEAELEKEGERLIYEVELLVDDGSVRELELDARDGRILKDEPED